MGSEIIKRGIKPGKLPDLLNIEEPDVIRSIHLAYYEAGSDMVQSNTFGSCYLNLKNHKLQYLLDDIWAVLWSWVLVKTTPQNYERPRQYKYSFFSG